MCLSYGGVGELLLFCVLTLGPLSGDIFYDGGGVCPGSYAYLVLWSMLPNLVQSWGQRGGGVKLLTFSSLSLFILLLLGLGWLIIPILFERSFFESHFLPLIPTFIISAMGSSLRTSTNCLSMACSYLCQRLLAWFCHAKSTHVGLTLPEVLLIFESNYLIYLWFHMSLNFVIIIVWNIFILIPISCVVFFMSFPKSLKIFLKFQKSNVMNCTYSIFIISFVSKGLQK